MFRTTECSYQEDCTSSFMVMSIIVQQNATIYSFIIFLQTAVHVSGDTLTHHQEHT